MLAWTMVGVVRRAMPIWEIRVSGLERVEIRLMAVVASDRFRVGFMGAVPAAPGRPRREWVERGVDASCERSGTARVKWYWSEWVYDVGPSN